MSKLPCEFLVPKSNEEILAVVEIIGQVNDFFHCFEVLFCLKHLILFGELA